MLSSDQNRKSIKFGVVAILIAGAIGIFSLKDQDKPQDNAAAQYHNSSSINRAEPDKKSAELEKKRVIDGTKVKPITYSCNGTEYTDYSSFLECQKKNNLDTSER